MFWTLQDDIPVKKKKKKKAVVATRSSNFKILLQDYFVTVGSETATPQSPAHRN